MLRILQGNLLIVASCFLIINNLNSYYGLLASVLFLVSNILGLYLHLEKMK